MLLVVAIARVEAVQHEELAALVLAKLGGAQLPAVGIEQRYRHHRLLLRPHHDALEAVGPIDRPVVRARRRRQLGGGIVDLPLAHAPIQGAEEATDRGADEIEQRIADADDLVPALGVVPGFAMRQLGGGVIRVALAAQPALVGGPDVLDIDRAVCRALIAGRPDPEHATGAGCSGIVDRERQVGLDRQLRHRIEPVARCRDQLDSERRLVVGPEPAFARGLLQQAQLAQAVALAPVDRRMAGSCRRGLPGRGRARCIVGGRRQRQARSNQARRRKAGEPDRPPVCHAPRSWFCDPRRISTKNSLPWLVYNPSA